MARPDIRQHTYSYHAQSIPHVWVAMQIPLAQSLLHMPSWREAIVKLHKSKTSAM